MKAVLLTGHGGPEKLVYREDVPDPVPGPADVLLQVGAAGVNNTDLWTREGAYGAQDDPDRVNGWRREALSFPLIQGADIVGTVVAVGDEIRADRVGERVIVDNALYTNNGEGSSMPASSAASATAALPNSWRCPPRTHTRSSRRSATRSWPRSRRRT